MSEYPVDTRVQPGVEAFLDEQSGTLTYVVYEPVGSACAIIDPVLDIDYAAGRLSFDQASKLVDFIRERNLQLEWIIETHVHADHLSAAPWLQEQLGGKIGIGVGITEVQEVFGKIFNEGTEFQRDGSQFDALFEDGATYSIGAMQGFAISTPGHTPACMTHVIGDSIFVGDTLFMPDGGSARVDFPGGDAATLYESIQRILAFPEEMRIFVCHDYGPNGREIRWQTTVAEEKAHNIHIGGNADKQTFIEMRNARDAQLSMPRLIIPSLQVNMRAGEVPTDGDGKPMLKVPVNSL